MPGLCEDSGRANEFRGEAGQLVTYNGLNCMSTGICGLSDPKYLRRYYLNNLTEEGQKNSVDYFQRAIAKDTRFEPAYAGVAEYYARVVYASTTSDISPTEASLKAKPAASKALELDKTLAEAHTALAMNATFYEWDLKEADREFRRAIALNPNYVPDTPLLLALFSFRRSHGRASRRERTGFGTRHARRRN